jgi:dihydrofolate synthase/folylpolyglutamate synthase
MPDVLPLSLRRRRPARIRAELEGLRRVLGTLGDPQATIPSVLVVGTNGKGSTAAMLDAILRAHGRRTGLYTSPHLVRPEERIRVHGTMVSRSTLEGCLERLEPFPELTFFETMTAAAFLIFAAEDVECAVLEAGMGGSWDATRLAASRVAGLTNVGTDHRQWLGTTREDIARDKGAALAAASWAVTSSGVDPALDEFLGAPGARRAAQLVTVCPLGNGMVDLSWDGAQVALEMPLPGRHQLANLELAVALALGAVQQGWLQAVDPDRVRQGLAKLRWPGRLSSHRLLGREVLLDGAHNLEGALALADFLAGRPRRFNLLFSCLADKPVEAMAGALRPLVDTVAVCPVSDERAMPIERLWAAFPEAVVAEEPAAALASLPDPVLATGSLRLIGALLAESCEVWL